MIAHGRIALITDVRLATRLTRQNFAISALRSPAYEKGWEPSYRCHACAAFLMIAATSSGRDT
jgi:hypothetical protein